MLGVGWGSWARVMRTTVMAGARFNVVREPSMFEGQKRGCGEMV